MAQFASWELADVLVSSRGAKQALLSDGSSKAPVHYKPEDALTVPFGITAWEEGSARKNLELRCSPSLEAFFGQFDEWLRGYLVEHSERLFKKKLTAEQVSEGYKSPLHRKSGYPPLLRTKVNATGRSALRFWDEHRNQVDEPTSWQDVEVKASLTLKSLWIQSPASFGFTVECSDLQLLAPAAPACPFT